MFVDVLFFPVQTSKLHGSKSETAISCISIAKHQQKVMNPAESRYKNAIIHAKKRICKSHFNEPILNSWYHHNRYRIIAITSYTNLEPYNEISEPHRLARYFLPVQQYRMTRYIHTFVKNKIKNKHKKGGVLGASTEPFLN